MLSLNDYAFYSYAIKLLEALLQLDYITVGGGDFFSVLWNCA